MTRIAVTTVATAALALTTAGTAQAAPAPAQNVVTSSDGAASAAVAQRGAHPDGGSWAGCPYGAVCVYPEGKAWYESGPEANGIYWSYGAHNLSNQFGYHWVLNNQSGSAYEFQCHGYNGTGGYANGELAGLGMNVNLTKVNSIVLTAHKPTRVCGEKV